MSASWSDARFLARPNRFLVQAWTSQRTVSAFLPNPGRLGELLKPGVRVRLLPMPSDSRSTEFDVLAVRSRNAWVCLDTRAANAAVALALDHGALPEFSGYRSHTPEVVWHESRFDFLLHGPGRCWLEVKTCSLVVDGRALFPDARTARGTRHVRNLADLVRRGDRAAVLFVVVRPARVFSPHDAMDPVFGAALRHAHRAGVAILARRASLHGARLVMGERIPIDL